MNKIIILFISVLIGAVFADNCFIIKENDKILVQEGDCNIRYAPCSTFKIALALMGYDSGILKDEMHPTWPLKAEYEVFLESWKNPQNPTHWMKNSCVWYSQVLTQQLGMEKFQDYTTKFDYGNKDLTGDKKKNNGLTHAWLSSSLKISSLEQVAFLEKFLSNQLPVSSHAQKMTKNILFLEDLPHGWKLYGKTGMGSLLNTDGTKNPDLHHGWFIGWIEKGNRKIIFVKHVEDDKKEKTYASLRAKAEAKEKLTKIINRQAFNSLL